MRVCIRKSDGRILEAQSNDAAPMDSLMANARGQSYADDEVEFVLLSDAEVGALISAQDEAGEPVEIRRKREYVKQGATIEALVVAMWEKNVEEIERLEATRLGVKQLIPKEKI
jgi:hypothetical protein